MKYWPLTAVLLAFWLGRETGADEDAPNVGKFDRIEVADEYGGMVLITSDSVKITSESGHSYTLKSGSARMKAKDGTAVHIEPGFVGALGPEKDGRQRRRATLNAVGNVAQVQATVGLHGSRLWAEPGVSIVFADTDGKTGVSIVASANSGANVSVVDNNGAQAVLGEATTLSKKTGESTSLPACTLTLRDDKGKVLTRLPK